MNLSDCELEVLCREAETSLYRARDSRSGASILLRTSSVPDVGAEIMQGWKNEHRLTEYLNPLWAVRPRAFSSFDGRSVLVLDDPSGQPLNYCLDDPADLARTLRLAISIAGAVREAHASDLTHRSLRPACVLVGASGKVWLTDFSSASHRGDARARALTLASECLPYRAPEQTGRIERLADPRSDLYSLGVIFYELLTGSYPFDARSATEWVHCHLARPPVPARQRVPGLPQQIDAILLTLLAKNADDRYPSAAALQADLSKCLTRWIAAGHIETFPVSRGEKCAPPGDPDRLYGRERHKAEITAALNRVTRSGRMEVVLISGGAGCGKSALIAAFGAECLGANCLFGVGKCDQFKRDIPYATLAHAIAGLVRHILDQSDRARGVWRQRIMDALGPNAGLMVNLAPHLSLVVGHPPPSPELPAHEAADRFYVVLKRLLAAFGQAGQPLVLFLDDLHWLDAATVDLVDRISNDDVSNLLLICAYRDSEIGSTHPLAPVLVAILNRKRAPLLLPLHPLSLQDVELLVADRLDPEPAVVSTLARHVWEKSAGNPLFAQQYVARLRDGESLEEPLESDAALRNAADAADPMVSSGLTSLLLQKLRDLPEDVLLTLQHLACLGTSAPVETLSISIGRTDLDVTGCLDIAARSRLAVWAGGIAGFVHDRVQELAYSLIPDKDLAGFHLKIARLLGSASNKLERQIDLFDIAYHYEKGVALINAPVEAANVAELLLAAGKRAKLASAYRAALKYVANGLLLIEVADRPENSRLAFELELERAECEFLTSDFLTAEERLTALASRARTPSDGARIVRVQVSLHITCGRLNRAVEVGLDYLRGTGVDWPASPDESFIVAEVKRLREQLGARMIADLAGLPVMRDPHLLAQMDVLAALVLAAQLTDVNLEDLVLLRMVNLSLAGGNSSASCYAYTSVNLALGLRLGDYASGLAFGRLGCYLADTKGMDSFKARTYCCFCSSVAPWTIALGACIELNRQAIGIASAAGDLVFVAASSKVLISNLLFLGHNLAETQLEAEQFLANSKRMGFSFAVAAAGGQLHLIRELSGAQAEHRLAHEQQLDTSWLEDEFRRAGNALAIPRAWHWVRQMQLHYHTDNFQQAIELADTIRVNMHLIRSFIEVGEYHFYAAISYCAAWRCSEVHDRARLRRRAEEHYDQIRAWRDSCPENFGGRAALVAADLARIDGGFVDALQGYENAARSAHVAGFANIAAIASVRAALLCLELGLTSAARSHVLDAHKAYLRWGATALARRIERQYPDLDFGRSTANLAARDGERFDSIDVSALVQMSQTIAGELFLDRLIQRLTVIAVEYAGAARGLLLLPKDGEMTVVAEATTGPSGITVQILEASASTDRLPVSVLGQVVRTLDYVFAEDVLKSGPYATDSYLLRARPNALLCLPLLKQGALSGVVYLESDLPTHNLKGARLKILQMLTSQAAISLENAALFRGVSEAREAARRAEHALRVSLDMIPAQAWRASADGKLEFANRGWHDYTGVSQDSSSLDGLWPTTIHQEDLPRVLANWRHMLASGAPGEVEARVRRHDGEYRRFLLRASPMRDERGRIVKWHGTNTDIQEMASATEAQEALARSSRLTALGELTVSIAHEINQPLMAIVTNAATCVRWLDDDLPNLVEARLAAERVVHDGHRAGEIVASIRALSRKAVLDTVSLDLNQVVLDVTTLMRAELERQNVVMTTKLSTKKLWIVGDRIQLQQVLLNLILNGTEAINANQGGERRILIRSRAVSRGRVEVLVSDTGAGIDPANVDRVFEAFYTTKPEGMGIGLSICRSIVERHGGTLSAQIESPHGTTFRFQLPAARAVPKPRSSSPPGGHRRASRA